MKILPESAKVVLKNSHATLTWMWIIIMVLAVEKAVENFIYCIDPVTGNEILRDWQYLNLQDVFLFIIFITTAVRFYHGESRYLDRTYLESQLETFQAESYSARYRFFDFYLLLSHAILFYALAAFERQLVGFFYIYTALLVLNVIWLGIVCCREPIKAELRYPRRWIINNTIHACLLIILYFATNGLTAGNAYIVFFVLAMSNTFFDYFTTWPYYFPPIKGEEAREPGKKKAGN